MTVRNWLIRTEIKLLWKHFPHQVKDILAEQGKHVAYNPGCAPKPTTSNEKKNRAIKEIMNELSGDTIVGQRINPAVSGVDE